MTDAALSADQQLPAEPGVLDDVPGWFWDQDRHLFDWFLGRQEKAGRSGDLMEMGAYLGRSAIVIGSHLQPGRPSRSATSSTPTPRTTRTPPRWTCPTAGR